MPVYEEPNNIGDLVKFEEDNYYSRDVVTLASGSNCVLGTVLGKVTATGVLKQLDPEDAVLEVPTGIGVAVGILLQDTNATTADTETIMLARHTTVCDKALVWKTGITAQQKTAAIAQLKEKGIIVRKGV
jgi:hypothetical protein